MELRRDGHVTPPPGAFPAVRPAKESGGEGILDLVPGEPFASARFGSTLELCVGFGSPLNMRKLDQKVVSNLKTGRREWKLYSSGDLKEFFGRTFWFRDQRYRIDGWIRRNPINPIYVIRERDGVPFVMSRADLDETDWVR